MIDHEYLPSNQQAEYFRLMGAEMKKCDHSDKALCPRNPEKTKECIHFRKDFLDENGTGDICTAPPVKKE